MAITNSCNYVLALAIYGGFFLLQTEGLTFISRCNKVCPDGEVCLILDGVCGSPPCEKSPVCIRLPSNMNKPGHCGKPTAPADCKKACFSDAGCHGNTKCCSNGCGMACSRPVFTPKDGTCPRSYRSLIANCRKICTNDQECSGSLKCCTTGCGSSCVEPRIIKRKPGVCPATMFINHCRTRCVSDTDCLNFEKCCHSACGTSCQNPVGVVTSSSTNTKRQCPEDIVSVSACWNRCTSDEDCFLDSMCCKSFCGRVCVRPSEGSSFYPQEGEKAIVLSTIS